MRINAQPIYRHWEHKAGNHTHDGNFVLKSLGSIAGAALAVPCRNVALLGHTRVPKQGLGGTILHSTPPKARLCGLQCFPTLQ